MQVLKAFIASLALSWLGFCGCAHGQTSSPPSAVAYGSEQGLQGLLPRLNLNESQLALWRQLALRVTAWEQNLYKEHPVWSAEANVVAEMGRMTLNLQNRLSLMEDLESAIKALYASLTPEQQAIVNPALLQSIAGLLPAPDRRDGADAPAQRQDNGRYGSGGSGRRRSGSMGGMGGMN